MVVPALLPFEDSSDEECEQTPSGAEPEPNRKRAKNSTTKNIIGYETKKAINLMFKKHPDYVRRKCKEAKIEYRLFKKVYLSAEKKIYGPVSIDKMFDDEGKSEEMRSVFLKIFNKILRKEYLIYSIKLGKMQDMEPYIREKNTKLLYYLERGSLC